MQAEADQHKTDEMVLQSWFSAFRFKETLDFIFKRLLARFAEAHVDEVGRAANLYGEGRGLRGGRGVRFFVFHWYLHKDKVLVPCGAGDEVFARQRGRCIQPVRPDGCADRFQTVSNTASALVYQGFRHIDTSFTNSISKNIYRLLNSKTLKKDCPPDRLSRPAARARASRRRPSPRVASR